MRRHLKISFKTEKADWIFIVPSTLIWTCSLLVSIWDFIHIQMTVYRFSVLNMLGVSLFAIGVSLRIIAKRTLGKDYSYGLKTPEKIVKHGIYGRIRHPCYFAMLLYVLGTPLIFSSVYGFLITLGFIPFTLYRIRIEEKMLTEKFGDEYREYVKKTKRIIPFIY